MKILFIRNKNSFLPEINAYIEYFNNFEEFNAFDSSKINNNSIEEFDVIWEFKGFRGNRKNKNQILIHEYASLSTGKFPKIKDFIKKLNLENQVYLLGFRSDINEILKISDLYVFPSKQEGLPVALMESMASGLPIICSNIRGNIDLIKHNKNGYLSNNIDEYIYYINKIYNNKKISKKFINYNNIIINNYSNINVMEKMKKIYKIQKMKKL